VEAFLAETAADAVSGIEGEVALAIERVADAITERAGRHLGEETAGKANLVAGDDGGFAAEGQQEAAGGVHAFQALGFAFLTVLGAYSVRVDMDFFQASMASGSRTISRSALKRSNGALGQVRAWCSRRVFW